MSAVQRGFAVTFLW